MAGRYSFVFTDIVGSTRLWAEHPDEMRGDLALHDDIVRTTIDEHRGVPFSHAGDSFGGAFHDAASAARAATAFQRRLRATPWAVPGGIRVRIGLHAGPAEERDGSFFGPALNEAARIRDVAHGDQIVVSAEIATTVDGAVHALGSHRLRDLDGWWELYELVHDDPPGSHPPLRSLGLRNYSLPAQSSRLIGRRQEVDAVGAAVRAHRLVTIIGPGGAGKTRLAVETAGRALAAFPDGAHFVDLTAAHDRRDVEAALVDALGRAVPPDRSPSDLAAEVLRAARSVVVFDNCEQVRDAAAGTVETLLRAAPRLHVLATSRTTLDVEGEHVVPLGPLDTEGAESDAVQLFLDRALAADPGLTFGGAELRDVADIVARLDGMPLAIELAAARMRTLDTTSILGLIDDRFRLLVGRRRGDERQRTLRAAIDWSFDLLDDADAELFLALAAFGGPVTLATVARLLDTDDLDAAAAMDRLVSQSLVVASRAAGVPRFALLESLRAYGRSVLAERGEDRAAAARAAAALLPPVEEVEADPSAFLNDHVGWTERTTIESATRRDAATVALVDGRHEVAALLLATATAPTTTGSFEAMLERIGAVREASGEIGPMARRALWAADLFLQTFSFRVGDALGTVGAAVAETDDDEPWGLFFRAWELLFTTVVEPARVVAETARLLPVATGAATGHVDYSVAIMSLARAIALLADDDVDAAHAAMREAVSWSRPGTGVHQATLSTLLWTEYTESLPRGPELAAAIASPPTVAWSTRVEIATIIAAERPVAERAAQLVELARRRPFGRLLYEESELIVPLAWLAIEEDRLDEAWRLLDAFACPDPATGTAGVRALDVITQRTEDRRLEQHEVLHRFVGPDLHDRIAPILPATLEAELRRWEERLR